MIEIELVRLHGTMSIRELADTLGITPGSVRGRVTRLGIAKNPSKWSLKEVDDLRAAYGAVQFSEDLDMDALSRQFGRTRTAISLKASKLGLANIARKKTRNSKGRPRKFDSDEKLAKHQSARMKEWLAQKGHPRGMAGKTHSTTTKTSIARSSAERWAQMSEDERAEHTLKGMKTRAALGSMAPKVARGSWKAGWREIGGKRNYYRSRWEANYARYLEWLKGRGEIKDWQHEPETFWFDAIKRGVRSYLPDFRVWENNGVSALHEVKGWMDARSKTTIKRMAKYHPHERMIVVREKEYSAIKRAVSGMIPDWE